VHQFFTINWGYTFQLKTIFGILKEKSIFLLKEKGAHLGQQLDGGVPMPIFAY
jgi:hypothetical protein